jgi:hypothetical protein
MSNDDYEKAKELYWQDPEEGKARYDEIRGPADADPDEWESNLQRSDAVDWDDDE